MWPGRETNESLLSIMLNVDADQMANENRSLPKYIDVENVRITPAKVVFEDAFAGRKYRKDIVVQNFGDHMVYVTTFSPTSISFRIKPLRQTPLPPGLKVSIRIHYTHSPSTSTSLMYRGLLPMAINDRHIHYPLEVLMSAARVVVTPTVLDFGCMDVASTTVTRKLVLHNVGSKATHFAIDLPKDNKQLIIEPKKGFLKEQQKIELTVELFSIEEGSFAQDVWVKNENPVSFCVIWTAIKPYLASIHPNATGDFTLIDFPRIYFGTSIYQSMVVQNRSSERLIYAIMAVVDQQITHINVAKEVSEDMRQFQINPVDGRMDPNEGRILQFVFTPVKDEREKRQHFDAYYLCVLKVIPLHFKDLYAPVFRAIDANEVRKTTVNSYDSVSMSASVASFMLESSSDRASSNGDDPVAGLTIYLHAEAETPHVTVVPTELHFADLAADAVTRRVLRITNNSQRLPIWLRYNKIPFVFVDPAAFRVAAADSLEIAVDVKVARIGAMHATIVFDLLSLHRIDATYERVGAIEVPIDWQVRAVTRRPPSRFVAGITPECANEVGFLVDDVRFNADADVEMPRAAMAAYRSRDPADADLVAFPNDRPLTLRPWRTDVNCRTIFAAIARNADALDARYALTASETRRRTANRTHYERYLRRAASRTTKPAATATATDDYRLTDATCLMLRGNELLPCDKVKLEKRQRHAEFVSLPASDLMLIKIKPSRIQLGQVAKQTTVQGSFNITNGIQMPIRVFLVPTANVEYVGGSRHSLKAHDCCEIKFLYVGKSDGIFETVVRVVINESHEYGVSVSGEVVPLSLFVDKKCIVFDGTDAADDAADGGDTIATRYTRHVDLYNPFQAYTQFRWDVASPCFDVQPSEGLVPSRSHLVCEVTYRPHRDGLQIADVNLIANYCLNHVLKLMAGNFEPRVSLRPERVEFVDVPLHLPNRRKVRLRNDGDETVAFEVKDPQPIDGVRIRPRVGEIPPNAIAYLDVSVVLDMAVRFAFAVTIDLKRNRAIAFELVGNVVYPEVRVEPRAITFRKIYEHAYDLVPLRVHNASRAPVAIDFAIANYKEIAIIRALDDPQHVTSVALAPGEAVDLYVEYVPLFVSTLNFLLPLIVNKLLGPAELDRIETQRNSYFMRPVPDHAAIDAVAIPELLPLVKVHSFVRKRAITFARFKMEFKRYECASQESILAMTNTIHNPTSESVEFVLRVDDVKAPFAIETNGDGDGDDGEPVDCVDDRSIAAVLPPKRHVTFRVTFAPSDYGEYACKVPVYVRDYRVGDDDAASTPAVYQYLTLRGTYSKPTIVPSVDCVHLEPIYCSELCCSEYVLTLAMHDHGAACVLSAYAEIAELKVRFGGERVSDYSVDSSTSSSSSCKIVKYATLSFAADRSLGFDTTVQFRCTCDCGCAVRVTGASDNCYCTNHAFLFTHLYGSCSYIGNDLASSRMEGDESTLSLHSKAGCRLIVNRNESPFPYFPEPDDTSYYARHMHRVVATVESWMHTQGFYARKYHIIPEDVAAVAAACGEDRAYTTPYFELFGNVAGKRIRKLIEKCNPSDKAIERAECLYQMYGQAIEMVSERGGLLPHVTAELLLPHEDYVVFVRDVAHQSPALPEDKFRSRALQAWLDLILQTYKVFVHHRPSLDVKYEYEYEAEICTSTRVLYDWLETLTAANAPKLWSLHEHHKLINFKVEVIVEALTDSYALACVTYHYCPYLRPYFEVFHMDNTYETQFFNAIKLLTAWKELNVTFDVRPRDIIEPNVVHMTMLIGYLYEFLPQLEVKETHTLRADLASATTKTLEIENVESYAVKYAIKFFADAHDCFAVDCDAFVVAARQRRNVVVRYHAKKIERQRAYLYVCGESRGYRYAGSHVIGLVGVPNLDAYTATHKIALRMYRKRDVELEIESPYKKECTYRVYVARTALNRGGKNEDDDDDDVDDDYENASFVDIEPSLYPKRVVITRPSFVCDASGRGRFQFYSIAFSPFAVAFHFYCRNDVVGDFCVRVMTTVRPHDDFEVLAVGIAETYASNKCTCTRDDAVKDDCPKTVRIMVPSRHKFLFDEFMNVFVAHLGNLSDTFWKKYARSDVCAHMIEKLKTPSVYVSEDITHIFNKDTVYRVKAKAKNVTLPKTIVIGDVKSLEMIPLRYHLNLPNQCPNDFQLTLISMDNSDVRHYYVNFYVQPSKSTISIRKYKKSSTEKTTSSTLVSDD